mgnify:CR=1 FL=1
MHYKPIWSLDVNLNLKINSTQMRCKAGLLRALPIWTQNKVRITTLEHISCLQTYTRHCTPNESAPYHVLR